MEKKGNAPAKSDGDGTEGDSSGEVKGEEDELNELLRPANLEEEGKAGEEGETGEEERKEAVFGDWGISEEENER